RCSRAKGCPGSGCRGALYSAIPAIVRMRIVGFAFGFLMPTTKKPGKRLGYLTLSIWASKESSGRSCVWRDTTFVNEPWPVSLRKKSGLGGAAAAVGQLSRLYGRACAHRTRG